MNLLITLHLLYTVSLFPRPKVEPLIDLVSVSAPSHPSGYWIPFQ